MADHIENFFYNPARRHSLLDYLTRPTNEKISNAVHFLGSLSTGAEYGKWM